MSSKGLKPVGDSSIELGNAWGYFEQSYELTVKVVTTHDPGKHGHQCHRYLSQGEPSFIECILLELVFIIPL